MITVTDILNAQKRINQHIIQTPLEFSQVLSDETGADTFLKLENLQVSGSFKPRGGFNKILKTFETNKDVEFVAPTAGGHGVGLSYAAKKLGAVAHILMPQNADEDRLTDIQQNGANVQLFESMGEADLEARRLEEEKGYIRVSAYNDVGMIEGGGTIALELLHQIPDIDCLVCGVGGGGYLAGMGIVLKSINPDIKIYGVQQEHSPFLAQWFMTGQYPENFQSKASLAEGIGGSVEKKTLTWPYIRDFVEDFILVSEDDIRNTVLWMLKNHKYYTEPSGIVGLSGIRKRSELFKGHNRIVTIITGRNMSFEKFKHIMK